MKSVALKAYPRSQVQRAEVTKLRAKGLVPATIYGRQAKPQNLEVNYKELSDLLHHSVSENLLVDLSVETDARAKRLALVQDIQHHPLSGKVLHIDFHEVLATEKLRTSVPVRPVGEPSGVKNGGGVLEFVMRELHVECLPQDLPDLIEVNVEKMEISQSIHVGDITPPDGVTLLDDKGQTVFLVAAPITEEELAAMTEAAAAPSAAPIPAHAK